MAGRLHGRVWWHGKRKRCVGITASRVHAGDRENFENRIAMGPHAAPEKLRDSAAVHANSGSGMGGKSKARVAQMDRATVS